MDPLWLSFLAIVVVIVSVLFIRLHPFLALTFGGLIVAIFTPQAQLANVAIRDVGLEVESVDGDQLSVTSGRPVTGRSVVFRRQHGNFREVGEVFLRRAEVQGSTALIEVASAAAVAGAANATEENPADSFVVAPGDMLVHESRYPVVMKSVEIGPGQRFATGFGDTCRKIGILIAMASVIGTCLLESGAARRIVDATRSLVGEKNTPVAFAASGFVVGIPVFFDTVFYLLMPLARAMRVKTGGNYLLYVMSIVVGATMAHSLVPPTPGPLLVASEIEGVSVGHMIVGGLIVGMISVSAGFLYCLWANRVWTIPLRDADGKEISAQQIADEQKSEQSGTSPADGQDAAENAGDVAAPSVFVSLLPIALPVLFLAGKTFADSFKSTPPLWLDAIRPVIDFVGDKNIALVIAAIVALATLAWQRSRSGETGRFDGIQRALASGGVIILITAAGGAFGHVLRQCGVAESIQSRFPSTQDGIVLLFLAFIVTAIVRFAQGSATVAMITGVSIVAPIATGITLPYHPVYLALAIGCGSKPLPWMNDSGFWIVGRMSGMTESETLKTFSVTLTIMGVVGFLVTLAGAKFLPLVGG